MINKTDGLFTKFYIAPESATLTTAANIKTAITTADEVENVSTVGDVSLGDYAVNTLAVFGGEFVKSFGSKTAGNLAVTIVFDALNASGQETILSMHANKTYAQFIIEYDDEPATGTTKNPTYVVFKFGVASASLPTTMDSVITLNCTLEMMEIPTLIKAATV